MEYFERGEVFEVGVKCGSQHIRGILLVLQNILFALPIRNEVLFSSFPSLFISMNNIPSQSMLGNSWITWNIRLRPTKKLCAQFNCANQYHLFSSH